MSETGTCPICGAEYDFKREETVAKHNPTILREDATACKTKPVGGERTVYVHR